MIQNITSSSSSLPFIYIICIDIFPFFFSFICISCSSCFFLFSVFFFPLLLLLLLLSSFFFLLSSFFFLLSSFFFLLSSFFFFFFIIIIIISKRDSHHPNITNIIQISFGDICSSKRGYVEDTIDWAVLIYTTLSRSFQNVSATLSGALPEACLRTFEFSHLKASAWTFPNPERTYRILLLGNVETKTTKNQQKSKRRIATSTTKSALRAQDSWKSCHVDVGFHSQKRPSGNLPKDGIGTTADPVQFLGIYTSTSISSAHECTFKKSLNIFSMPRVSY